MMVMRSTSPTFYTPISHQEVSMTPNEARPQYDTRPTIVVSPPPRPAREAIAESRERPRENRPVVAAKYAGQVRETKNNSQEGVDGIENVGTSQKITAKEQNDPAPTSTQESQTTRSRSSSLDANILESNQIVPFASLSRTDSAPAEDWSHRRARSHFSIPDVIVTSCVEEGEEIHFEVQVEPTRRKTSLPTLLSEIGSESSIVPLASTSRNQQLTQSQSIVLQATQGTSSIGKAAKALKSKPKPLSIRADEANASASIGAKSVSPTSASAFPTSPTTPTMGSTNNKEAKTGMRLRKSSFPSIFSKKERDAANAAASIALPPSPTIRQGAVSPPPPQSPSSSISNTIQSPMSSFFPSSPTSLNTANSASTPTSPSFANMPSSPTSIRSFSKKELKAKAKEEKNLMKELEKINKMVRKHDEKAQKEAAKKAMEKEQMMEEVTQISAKEGKTKRVLRRMTVFRPSATVNKSSLPLKEIKGSEGEVQMEPRTRNDLPPLEQVISSPTKARATKVKKDSDESDRGHSAWSTDQWSDVPSPLEERFPSLTSSSPVKSEFEEASGKKVVESISPLKSNTSLKRNGSTSTQRALAKMEADRSARRRSTTPTGNTNNAPNKRRSKLGNQFKLGLDFIEGADMGWEDALDSPVKGRFSLSEKDDGQATPTPKDFNNSNKINSSVNYKRSTLLESLYKDLDEMELSFQRDRGVVAPSIIKTEPVRASKVDLEQFDREASSHPEAVSSPISSTSKQVRSRPSVESSGSSGRGSGSVKSSTPSSPVSPSSVSSRERSTRKSRVGHNPKGFQFPPPSSSSPSASTIDNIIKPQAPQRADTLPLDHRRDEQWMDGSMNKSTSSPSLFF